MSRRNTPYTFVASASVGGAAASPIDPEINVAPMRDVAYIAAVELRAGYAPADPWDPWAPVRIGYDAPPPSKSASAPAEALDRLARYLNATLS